MKVDLKILDKYVLDGKLRKAENEFLVQYNYSDYLRDWDDITRSNRGHIYEKGTGILVCNALKKFFNYDELSDDTKKILLNRTDFIVTKKYDGCMGLIYTYKGKLYCNSRGAFNNYVTDCMWKIIESKGIYDKLNGCHYNLMAEVIHPKTKILVDYGTEKELILITAFDKITHEEVSIDILDKIADEYGLKSIECFNYTIDDVFKWQKTHNYTEEGFVLRYSDNYRVKMKSYDYIRVQAVKALLDINHLWNLMYDNANDWKNKFNNIKENLSEELFDIANELMLKLEQNYNTEYSNLMSEVEKYINVSDKDLALKFKNNSNKYIHLIFAYRHNKNIEKGIIKLIEPP